MRGILNAATVIVIDRKLCALEWNWIEFESVHVFVCAFWLFFGWFRFLNLISFGCMPKQSTEMWRRIIPVFFCLYVRLMIELVSFQYVYVHAVENENHQVPRQQDEKVCIIWILGETHEEQKKITQRPNKWKVRRKKNNWNYFNLFYVPSLYCDGDVVFVFSG